MSTNRSGASSSASARASARMSRPSASVWPISTVIPFETRLWIVCTAHDASVGVTARCQIAEACAGDAYTLVCCWMNGPVGVAFANALSDQKHGHSNLLAVLTPNLICKPATVLITKVTIKGAGQAVQMFGPAQAAVARAVVDSVAEGVISKSDADNLVIVCGVSIAKDANDNKKIYKNNYEAVKLAIKGAMRGEPKIDEIIAKKETKHPFE